MGGNMNRGTSVTFFFFYNGFTGQSVLLSTNRQQVCRTFHILLAKQTVR